MVVAESCKKIKATWSSDAVLCVWAGGVGVGQHWAWGLEQSLFPNRKMLSFSHYHMKNGAIISGHKCSLLSDFQETRGWDGMIS